MLTRNARRDPPHRRRPRLPRARAPRAHGQRPTRSRRGRERGRGPRAARRLAFAAAMIDVGLPDGSGIALAGALRPAGAAAARARLLGPGRRQPDEVRRCGAGAFVPKQGAPERALGGAARGRLATRSRWDTVARVPPVRVVVGEDDVLMREGIVRVLADAASTSSRTPATPTRSCAGRSRTSRRGRHRHPDAARNEDDGLRAALELRRQRPRSACSCSRSSTRSTTRSN